MLKHKFFFYAAFFYALFAFAVNAQEAKFRGQVAGNKVEMTLKRDGTALNGNYFYVKSGSANGLKLTGKIGADNKFTLQERDAAGKATGVFSGTWKNDPNESGASLEGEWKKPSAKGEPQFFWAFEDMAAFTDGTKVVTRQTNESVKAKRLDVNAEYPELVGSGKNFAAFNQLAKKMAIDATTEFKKEMLTLTAEDLKHLPAGVNNFIEIGYSIEYADSDFISVKFSNSTYAGGAHPNTNYYTLNFDLKAGEEIALADLFKPATYYLDYLSAQSVKDLAARKIPDSNENAGLAQDTWAEGASAIPDNYRSWNITRKGLMITFDPYQVGPYAAGPQTVIVPYAKLKNIANPDGVLAKMAK